MSDKSIKAGVIFALAAYGMWGIAPLYFKLLTQVPALEILMHRIVWSVLVLLALVYLRNKFDQVQLALRNPKVIKILLISGLLLACNWLLFIWAVNNNHLLDASLGYFINPLFNVLLARLFLQEQLSKLQFIAVLMALGSVGFLVISHGQVPWIALILASTFSVYGLLRKKVAVDSMPGLLIESSMMLPFALLYWLMADTVAGNMLLNEASLNLTLLFAGIVTTAPLLCFTAAARRIRYTTLGFFQYLGPSIMFFLAVGFYQETLEPQKAFTFMFVWLALIIYVYDSFRQYQKAKAIQV